MFAPTASSGEMKTYGVGSGSFTGGTGSDDGFCAGMGVPVGVDSRTGTLGSGTRCASDTLTSPNTADLTCRQQTEGEAKGMYRFMECCYDQGSGVCCGH